MRILHTADWHLGRQFHNVSLLDDQAHVLDQVVDVVRRESVDVVIIAGDVFDRSVPPAAATTLLDDVLHRLTAEGGIDVIVIPGNHDGAERLGFGARALAKSGIHIRHRFDPAPLVLHDDHGPVAIHCLPYADPAAVNTWLGTACAGHDEAMAALLARLDAPADGARRVLVAHCFVTGGDTRESERPLSVGGAEMVSASRFEPFHYTALGHLHNAQSFLDGRVRYPGSLMKYSFSESEDAKSVLVVDVDGDGGVDARAVPLAPRRDLRVIDGLLDDLLAAGADDADADDYLLVRLQDTRAILDVMTRLRAVYPHVLHVERPALRRAGERRAPARREGRGELPLFADFWREVTGDPLDDARRTLVAAALDALRREDGD